MAKKKEIWEEVEYSAWMVLKEFRERPIRTVFIALLVIWFIRWLFKWVKG